MARGLEEALDQGIERWAEDTPDRGRCGRVRVGGGREAQHLVTKHIIHLSRYYRAGSQRQIPNRRKRLRVRFH